MTRHVIIILIAYSALVTGCKSGENNIEAKLDESSFGYISAGQSIDAGKPLVTLIDTSKVRKIRASGKIVSAGNPKIIIDHFNVQSMEGRRESLTSVDFDELVDVAESIYFKKVAITEKPALA